MAEFLSNIDFSSNELNNNGIPTQRTTAWRNAKDAFEKILNKWYYMGILEDTAGYAGLELIRRVVGSAKAEDIVSLGQGKRAEAERRILEMGIDLVLNRNKFREPGAFKNMFVRSGS